MSSRSLTQKDFRAHRRLKTHPLSATLYSGWAVCDPSNRMTESVERSEYPRHGLLQGTTPLDFVPHRIAPFLAGAYRINCIAPLFGGRILHKLYFDVFGRRISHYISDSAALNPGNRRQQQEPDHEELDFELGSCFPCSHPPPPPRHRRWTRLPPDMNSGDTDPRRVPFWRPRRRVFAGGLKRESFPGSCSADAVETSRRSSIEWLASP